MSNHLTASPPPTLPPPPTSAPAAATPATTAVSSSSSPNGSSGSTISRLNGDRLKSSPAPTSQTLVPGTTNHTGAATTLTETLHPTPVGPPTVIAHALKSLSNLDVALRDKPGPPLYDSSSPYARSLSSTAPGSPRMWAAPLLSFPMGNPSLIHVALCLYHTHPQAPTHTPIYTRAQPHLSSLPFGGPKHRRASWPHGRSRPRIARAAALTMFVILALR